MARDVCVKSFQCVCVCVCVCRVWRPGPEDGRENPFDSWKRVYLEFGFVFIQDMVERALMEEIVAAGEWREGGREEGKDGRCE